MAFTVTGGGPTGSGGANRNFTGTVTGYAASEYCDRVQIELRLAGGAGALVWSADFPVPASQQTAHFYSVEPPGLLKSGITYGWRQRGRSSRTGVFTNWSGYLTFSVVRSIPVATIIGPNGATLPSLNGVRFQVGYSDADGKPLGALQLRVRPTTAPGDPLWDGIDNSWDVSPYATTSETAAAKVDRPYGGAALPAGAYSWQARVRDTIPGNWSDPVYGTFTTTAASDDATSPAEVANAYVERRWAGEKARVVIRALGANRGPGTVVAVIYDAQNLGASEFYNSGGEFYFTLPATHPQVAVIEPWQVHYALEVHQGGGWVEKSAGLIVDYNATENDVVFNGLDYMGLLGLMYDDRFNPEASADLAVENGGSKYSDWKIGDIIRDQLTKEQARVNGLLGFVAVPLIGAGLDTLNEHITIFSTFKQRLPFIAGLIESHRAGTGHKTRLSVVKQADGTYAWHLAENPGADRDTIRLEYGGMLTGFNIVPFGSFSTRVYGIGKRVPPSSVLDYDIETAPNISESTYGAIPSVNLWQDTTDLNDLKRRVKQRAMNVAKVGKQMALGIRVDALGLKNGWDVTDSIPVVIKRGVVDTTNFGSGYWTVWGWQWEYHTDGETDLTLSILPREDTSSPDPDLIDSVPTHTSPEWQVGYAPPDANTDSSHWFVDVSVGAVWEKDPSDGTWVVVTPIDTRYDGIDGLAPATPTGLAVSDGIEQFIATWDRNTEPDLDRYEVEYAVDDGSGTGPGGSPSWAEASVRGTSLVVRTAPGRYWVRVRAVDASGNASTESGLVAGDVRLVVTDDITPLAITRTRVADNAIDTPQLNANAVTADKLATVLLLASLIKTSESGQRVEIDDAGIRLLAADDELLVNIPTDADAPVYIHGDVAAGTLISNAATLRGASSVAKGGVLTLEQSVTAPVAPPALSAYWDSVSIPAQATGVPRGLQYSASGGAGGATKVFYAVAADGSCAYELKASDRTINRTIALPVVAGTHYAQSACQLGAYVFVLDMTFMELPGDVEPRVYRFNLADLSLSATYLMGGDFSNVAAGGGSPQLTSDGTNLVLADVASTVGPGVWDGDLLFQKYTNAMAVSGGEVDTGYAPGGACAALAAGNFDFGAWRLAAAFAAGGPATAETFNASGTRQTNESFPTNAASSSLTYGDALGDGARFWSAAFGTALVKHSNWTWTTESPKYWVAYAWYDSAGTTHETAVGPRANITLGRRRWLSVTNAAIPTGGADDPDRVRIYMERGAGDPGATNFKLQATDALTVRALTAFNAAGAADGSGTAFPSGTPGELKSAATGFSLKGDGSAAFTTARFLSAKPVDLSAASGGWLEVSSAQEAALILESAAASSSGLYLKRTGEANYRAYLSESSLNFGAGGASATDVNLYRAGANALKTDDQLQVGITGRSGADNLLILDTTAGAGLTIGSDVNLYRAAANQLATDDDLIVQSALAVNGSGIYLGADVNLLRSGANILGTDDAFRAVGNPVAYTNRGATGDTINLAVGGTYYSPANNYYVAVTPAWTGQPWLVLFTGAANGNSATGYTLARIGMHTSTTIASFVANVAFGRVYGNVVNSIAAQGVWIADRTSTVYFVLSFSSGTTGNMTINYQSLTAVPLLG